MAFGTMVHGAETRIREWLLASKIDAGRRLPSERALAKLLDLGHYALNRAMARLIAEGLVVRQGYKLFAASPQPKAAAFTCHLVLPHRSSLLRSFHKTAKELGIELVLHRWETLEESILILRQLDSPRTEGVLFDPPISYSARYWEEAVGRLASHGVPIVCVRSPAKGASSVLGDFPRALVLIFDHLRELGHRELALMSPPPFTPALAEIVDTWRELCLRNGFAASAKRIQIPNNSHPLREDIADFADRLSGEWNEVTAAVDYTENESNIPYLLEQLTLRRKRVPQDLSLLCLRDSTLLRTLTPPVSVAESDPGLIHEAAFRTLQRLARKKAEPGLPASPVSIRVQPELILRGSTGPSRTTPSPTSPPPPKEAPALSFFGWTEQALESAVRRPYPTVARVDASRFVSLDLAPHVNRPLNFRRGWLGDLPLKHLPPGSHAIHGVPFLVLGGPRRADCGAVIFQSGVNTKGNTRELPVRLRLPIGTKARAVYFLHGCGYARFLKPFAAYGFYRSGGRGKAKLVDEVPLIPLGQPPSDYPMGVVSPDFLKANIQDWWPDLPQMDFPQARRLPINQCEPDDPVQRHVSLYTLEWINPDPSALLDHIDIEVDPDHSTTLGLVAVTLLRA